MREVALKRSVDDRPSVSVAYVRLMLSLLSDRGLSRTDALHAARIDNDVLERPEGLVAGSAYRRLIEHSLTVTDDPCLGCELGLRMPPTAHNTLGLLLVTSATFGEALSHSVRFFVLASQVLALRPSIEGASQVISIDEIAPLGPVRQFVIESALLGLYRAGELLTMLTQPPQGLELCFTWPEPAAFARYRSRLPPAKFSQPFNQLRCPKLLLDQPLPLANSLASRRALRECERALAGIPELGAPLIARVYRALTPDAKQGYASLASVARLLDMSPRTLHRKLVASGTSFSDLLDRRRALDARRLLAEPSLSIADISHRLGYADPANFTRAFRKQVGQPPTAYRARLIE